jgi:hypothetical protein
MTWRNGLALVFGDDRLENIPLRSVSICLLIAALGFAWIPHQHPYMMFWHTWISFTPDFMSGALALAIIAPLYARRIIPYPYHSLNNALFFIVNLALMATFIQITLGKGTTMGTLPSLTVIICAIALSWLGMRAAASLAWIVILVFCVISAIMSNDAWGLQGFGFVAAGFAGILLQTPLNPAGLFAEILSEYGGHPSSEPLQNTPDRSHLIEN